MAAASPRAGPLFWGIGIVALLWHGMGCINLAQQMTPEGVASLPDRYQSFIATRPAWATAAFALSVIAGLVGSILLLMRRPQAKQLFILACLGALITFLPTIGFGEISVVIGTVMSAAFAAFLAWFAGRTLAS